MSSSSSQDIIKDLDVLSPAVNSMTESSTYSSSDEDSSNKQDIHQTLEPSMDSSIPNTLALKEEPLGEEGAEPAPVDIRPVDVESLIVEDQKQDEDSPAISFDTSIPMLTCEETSNSLAPNTVNLLISSDLELVKNSEHTSVYNTSNTLSRKISSGSVCLHHVSFLSVPLSNLQTILCLWF